MDGLMMESQLCIPAMLRRAERFFGQKPIVSRLPDRSLHRYTYGECIARARRLGAALHELGLQRGDRVGTFCWNHYRHLEAYYGVPAAGLVVHTLNIRLHPDEIAYIANHAGDRAIIVDKVLWPLFEKFRARLRCEHIIVVSDDGVVPEGTIDYEALLAASTTAVDLDDVDERLAAGMCYTSGTTGRPKGVVYSHRSLTLHTFGAIGCEGLPMRERDVVLPVVPMFHANAWGLPFTCAMAGASQVQPGPHLDPVSILELLAGERVTLTAGVPTIWIGLLQTLDADPKRFDLSALRGMMIGGAAVPEAMVRAFADRHGLDVIQGWGMTEMSPIGTISTVRSWHEGASESEQQVLRARQGYPLPFVEIRSRNQDGLVPWDGATMGELEVRGPWISRAYYAPEDDVSHKFTADGWFCTGDIVTIEPDGCVVVQDRAKDLIKSGGEWISSVALESALMGHPAVSEAAVIAASHPQWGERPLGVVVFKPGRQATAAELRELLAGQFAKWWLPDDIIAIDAIPRTSAGKFLKSALRERFRDHYAAAVPVPPAAPAAQPVG
jgi:acyl-CoA synthetase (AMP-forming)/AMP-acid ligase II